ncbi:MAG: permease [Proteobacteria bacterium]|nr:permease [Pseudomonadota bacterium]
MLDLETWQFGAFGLIFVWSGFVRSGLGFGGAALALPMLLLLVDNPLTVMPILAVQLLVFSAVSVVTRLDQVDWPYLLRSLPLLLPFTIAGVLGLLNLPGSILSIMVYAISATYAISYLSGFEFKSKSQLADRCLLALGGYASGTSLIGAPLIAAVYLRHLPRERLRETLIVLWGILVIFKMSAFIYAGVDLQLRHQVWLLPCATLGHCLGLWLHRQLVRTPGDLFMRAVGAGLLTVTLAGLWLNFT